MWGRPLAANLSKSLEFLALQGGFPGSPHIDKLLDLQEFIVTLSHGGTKAQQGELVLPVVLEQFLLWEWLPHCPNIFPFGA